MRVLKLISDATTTLFYLQFLMGFLRKSLLEWLFFKVEEEHHKVLSIFFLYAVYPTIFCEITCSLKFRIWETMQAIVTKMQLENAGLLQFSGNVGHFNPVANHQPIFRSCKQEKQTY